METAQSVHWNTEQTFSTVSQRSGSLVYCSRDQAHNTRATARFLVPWSFLCEKPERATLTKLSFGPQVHKLLSYWKSSTPLTSIPLINNQFFALRLQPCCLIIWKMLLHFHSSWASTSFVYTDQSLLSTLVIITMVKHLASAQKSTILLMDCSAFTRK